MLSTGPPNLSTHRMTSEMSGSSKQGQSLDSATQLIDTNSKHSQHMRNLEVGLISNTGNSTAFHRQHLTNVTLFSLLFSPGLFLMEWGKNWHLCTLNTDRAHIIIQGGKKSLVLCIFTSEAVSEITDQQMLDRSTQLLCNTNLHWVTAFMIKSLFYFITITECPFKEGQFHEEGNP